ncbi:MMPL family transporter [Streptomyces odontomachi]|uniref:MMPL family transporter n=1 Tax=Streptomyces odontomachi TaxID=2944940 RepID=UPI00210B2FCC|nr:MMPL family transporter [Streptomyces sp. ODS25]
MASRRNFAAKLGEWSAGHRKTAVFGWLVLAVLVMVFGMASGQVNLTEADYGTGDSGRAERILQDAGLTEPAPELILVHSDKLTTDDPAFRKAVTDTLHAVQATHLAQHMQDPATNKLYSKDHHSALIQYEIKGDPETAPDRVQPVIDAVTRTDDAHQDVTLGQYGEATGVKAINDSLGTDFARAEYTALPVSLAILLVVFGAFVAAVLPLLLAVTACLAAMGLLALTSHLVPVDGMTNSVMFLMGLAVGVDYCLFYLRRAREERAAGRDNAAALRIAAATSGHSVLISGLTVVVAMAGMFLSGLTVFEGFAIATIEVVLIAVVGSMTVLPAMMAWLGDRMEKGRIPFLAKHRAKQAARAAEEAASGVRRKDNALLRGVVGHPGVFGLLAAVVLLALAAPALGIKTEKLSTDKLLPSDNPLVTVSQQIGKEFPGAPGPADVVVKADDINAPAVKKAIADFQAKTAASGQAGGPVRVTVHAKQNIAEISVPLVGNGTDAKSKKALTELREDLIPATFDKVDGTTALVRGDLAFSVDYNDQLHSSIVPVFAFVLGVTFLLMLFFFRSPVIALTTIVLNLLSVGAAYGVMAAVFQHGWGASLVGTEKTGAIESWMPLFVFVVLFGLSMDYHVFVVSRIREAHDRGATTREAVAHGIRSTAAVVTSAGLIMVAVFAVFGTLGMQDFKQLGVGLAVAVFLDATIVRAVLLPSVMLLLGRANWIGAKPRGGVPGSDGSDGFDGPSGTGAGDPPVDAGAFEPVAVLPREDTLVVRAPVPPQTPEDVQGWAYQAQAQATRTPYAQGAPAPHAQHAPGSYAGGSTAPYADGTPAPYAEGTPAPSAQPQPQPPYPQGPRPPRFQPARPARS